MTETYGISANSINRKPENGGNGLGVQKEISPTLTATDRHAIGGSVVHPEAAGTLCASAAGLSRPGGMGSETDLCVAYCLQGNMVGRSDSSGPNGNGINEETAFTLTRARLWPSIRTYRTENLYKYLSQEGSSLAKQNKTAAKAPANRGSAGKAKQKKHKKPAKR